MRRPSRVCARAAWCEGGNERGDEGGRARARRMQGAARAGIGRRPTMTQRGAGARYMRLAQSLLRQIGDGTYPPQALLPTEHELCRQYDVSRITVRAAMRELQERGVIDRKPGVGTRVAASQPSARFMHVGDSVDDILQFTRGLSFRVHEVDEVVVDAELAQRLGVGDGQRFVRVCGVRRGPGKLPVVFSSHYVPALHADAVQEMDGHRASLAELVAERRGVTIDEIRQGLDATRLGAREARLLEARRGTPCLRSTRRYYAPGGALLLASVSLFPEGRYVFNSRLRRAAAGPDPA